MIAKCIQYFISQVNKSNMQRMCCTDRPNAVHMSQSPDFVLEGDKLTISCTASYTGQFAPDFDWHPFPDVTKRYDTDSTVTSVAQVTVPADSVQSYTCYVRFDGSVFPASGNQTSTPVKTSGEWVGRLLSSLFRVFCDYCMPICCGYCCGYRIMWNLWTNTRDVKASRPVWPRRQIIRPRPRPRSIWPRGLEHDIN